MNLVYIFSACLVLGMVISQSFDLGAHRGAIIYLTNTALAYIMICVGLEFTLNKKRWKSYIKDYFVAMLAAALPWIFCFIYFIYFFDAPWGETLVIARFAAPTSSGILFSMLAAAGLATTWLFKKVEILAIFDDVDTILLMIPLQFLLAGAKYKLLFVVVFIIVLVILAWQYLHKVRLPMGRGWLFLYGAILAAVSGWIQNHFLVEIEVLLPAFVLGCMLYNPHDPTKPKEYAHEHAYIEPEGKISLMFDRSVKIIFMLLVGFLLPKIVLADFNITRTIIHVLLITILSNLGKCAPMFFYRNEAPLNERAGVSIGMFPRGEVGAGILVLAIEHGVGGYTTTVAALSLALNLVLTGVFIAIVIRLVRMSPTHAANG